MKARLIALTVAICCTTALHAQNEEKKDPYKKVDNDVRLEALRHSQVWMPGDIASKNIEVGPAGWQWLRARGGGQLRLRRREADRHAEIRLRHLARRQDSGEVRRGERRNLLGGRFVPAAVGPRLRRRPRLSGQSRLQRMPCRSDEDPEESRRQRASSPPRSSSGSSPET